MKLLLVAVATLAVLACEADPQAVGDALVSEWPARHPDHVLAVSFENDPPLDPPTLFVDLAPSMTREEQLAFLCEELRPRASDAGIDVTVTFGWHSSDCP